MQVMVSVLCTAYNHGAFIEKTIEGFIKQKVNFSYEILINDDASLDDTAEKIRKYEEQYPNIIKGIYQKENQYSKGVKITKEILLPRANGKYIALCEGDDYWIDENKLQIQFDYMEANPNCTFCFGNANIYDVKRRRNNGLMIPQNCIDFAYFYGKDSDYTMGQLALLGFIPTATFFLQRKIYFRLSKIENSFNGDQKIKLYATSYGYAHYFNTVFSQYNVNVVNSSTYRWKRLNKREMENQKRKFLLLAEEVDRDTNYVYTDYLSKLKDYYVEIILKRPYWGILKRDKRYLEKYKSFSWKKKIGFYIRMILPTKVFLVVKKILKRV